MSGPDSQAAHGPPDKLEFEWRPADLIRRREPRTRGPAETPESGSVAESCSPDERFALVVLNQPLHTHLGLVRRLWDNACVRVAADGGANCLYEAAGVHGDPCFDDLDTIIGDLDSLSPSTRHYYESRPLPSSVSSPGRVATQILLVAEQDSTDFAKAVAHVRDSHDGRQQESQQQHQQQQLNQHPPPCSSPRGEPPRPLDIVALGGLGGRVDQGVSQLHHLFLFQAGDAGYERGRVFLFSGESLTWLLKPGLHRIRVRGGRLGRETERNDDTNGPLLPRGPPHPSHPPRPSPSPPSHHAGGTRLLHPAARGDEPRDAASPRRGVGAAAEGRPAGGAEEDEQGENENENEDGKDVFGKHVGILPVGGPSVITTRGLEWDVRDWRTEFGGRVSTSNHVLPETEVVEVETTREVLFTIAVREV